ILSRRTWAVHAWDEIARRKGEGELEHWLRLRSWAEEAGIPRRFFLCPASSQLPEHKPLDEAPKDMGGKPQLIDLDNAFLVRALEKLGRRVNLPLYLQELLPTPEDAVATVNGRAHALELCLELIPTAGA